VENIGQDAINERKNKVLVKGGKSIALSQRGAGGPSFMFRKGEGGLRLPISREPTRSRGIHRIKEGEKKGCREGRGRKSIVLFSGQRPILCELHEEKNPQKDDRPSQAVIVCIRHQTRRSDWGSKGGAVPERVRFWGPCIRNPNVAKNGGRKDACDKTESKAFKVVVETFSNLQFATFMLCHEGRETRKSPLLVSQKADSKGPRKGWKNVVDGEKGINPFGQPDESSNLGRHINF